MRELRLRLAGTTPVFPDGRPICLDCGREPAGTRRVYFENTQARGIPGLPGVSLFLKLSALRNRIVFDAPLCAEHRTRARFYAIAAVVLGLLSLALIGGGMVWVLEAKQDPGLVDFWPALPGLVCLFLAYGAWELKDRGGLECEARRAGEDLVLTYPDPGEKPS